MTLIIAFVQISGDMAAEHVNGNGTEESMDTYAAVAPSEHLQTLLDAGLPQKVAEKLDEIYISGKTWLLQKTLLFWLYFLHWILSKLATFCGFQNMGTADIILVSPSVLEVSKMRCCAVCCGISTSEGVRCRSCIKVSRKIMEQVHTFPAISVAPSFLL